LLLSIIQQSKLKLATKFVQYDQSEHVKEKHQSSVSYAAGITYLVWSSIDVKFVWKCCSI